MRLARGDGVHTSLRFFSGVTTTSRREDVGVAGGGVSFGGGLCLAGDAYGWLVGVFLGDSLGVSGFLGRCFPAAGENPTNFGGFVGVSSLWLLCGLDVFGSNGFKTSSRFLAGTNRGVFACGIVATNPSDFFRSSSQQARGSTRLD